MDYRKLYAIKAQNEKRIKILCPNINNESGIYVFTRIDENNIKFAYIGQAKHLLSRASDHLSGYQHIDLSIKKHGLFNEDKNPCGWKLNIESRCHIVDLDQMEQLAVLKYAQLGYQLRNKTTGGQATKSSISDSGKKGYLQGKKDGYDKAVKELSLLISKYTNGLTSQGGKIADRKTAELIKILEGEQ